MDFYLNKIGNILSQWGFAEEGGCCEGIEIRLKAQNSPVAEQLLSMNKNCGHSPVLLLSSHTVPTSKNQDTFQTGAMVNG